LSLATPRRLLLPALVAAFALALLPTLASAGGHGSKGHSSKVHHRVALYKHGKHHGHKGHRGHGHGGHHGHGHGHGHGHPGHPGGGDSGRGHEVNAMTRNLYLGADLGPAIGAPSLEAFVAANGNILNEVTANDFPVRAKGLADEILDKAPDLVGLQEVALWRTGPPSLTPVLTGEPTATTVRYDYLQLLLDQLNRKKPQYEVVVAQDEFDLEAPADENGVAGDNPDSNPAIANAEINGRLTMRDVILVRRGAGVQIANPQSGNFETLLAVPILGQPLTIKRGWTATDAKVRGSGWFRFVNTHLEAFDPAQLVPSIRALQAAELVAPGGPAADGELPVVLLGDLNSDDDTVEPGDQQAYRVLLEAGLVERSTNDPLSCCLESSLLAEDAGGSVADFDHQVDHVMTDEPDDVELRSSSVTGLLPVNGFWNSDHAGVFSALRFDR
jgi:endonuclease/exonuclease/phosphatase family metal-dependent hydrolase